MAFTQDTNPIIKNKSPTMRIEIKFSLFVKELIPAGSNMVVEVVLIQALLWNERRAAED